MAASSIPSTLTVGAYDTANNLLGSSTRVGGDHVAADSFVGGVVSGSNSIGRINLVESSPADDGVGVDDAAVYALAPAAIIATKWDALPGGAPAAPGAAISYTVAITNGTTMNALDVAFADTLDANTTLIPGSVRTTPIARDDGPYASLGNVGISVPAGSGVLANDNDPDGTGGVSVFSAEASSVNGGSVSVNPDGSFTYMPAPGFEGSDSFNYTIQDGDGYQDGATVSINVSGMIWFVDNSSGAGDGRLSSPFNSISALNAIQTGAAPNAKDGDIVFIATGSGVYTSGISLLNNQKLIGQGATASIAAIAGITVPPYSYVLPGTGGSRPTIGDTTNAVIIRQNNTLRGFDIGNTVAGGAGIANLPQNVSFGTLTVNDMAIGGAGRAINILGHGTLAVTLDSITTSADFNGVVILGTSGTISGNFMVSGATTMSNMTSHAMQVQGSNATYDFGTTSATNIPARGIELSNNSGASFTFDSLTISNSGNTGLFANNSGTLYIAGTTNTIATTNGTGIDLNNTTIGSNITFQSIGSTNSTNGISLQNTGSSGSFTITGSGTTAGSGGTLSGHSAEGILLNNVPGGASISNMVVNQASTSNTQGIDATSVTGLSIIGTTITAGSGSSYAMLGSTVRNWVATSSIFDGGGGNVPTYDGVFIINLLGINNITNSTFQNGKDINLLIENNLSGGGQDSITLSGAAFSNSAGGDHLQVNANGTANLNLVVNAGAGNTTFSGTGQDAIQVAAQDSATFTAMITQATFNNTLGATVNMGATSNGHLIAYVHNLTGLTSSAASVINVIGLDTSIVEATIENNTITSGTAGHGIRVIQEGSGTVTANLASNNISGITQGSGILTQGRAGTGRINATINNNIVATTGVLSLDGIEVTSGSSAGGDTNTICLNMLNNNSSTSGSFDGYFLHHRTGTTFQLQDFAGPATDPGITAWVNTTKSNTGTVFVTDAAGFTAAPGACPTPTVPMAPVSASSANNTSVAAFQTDLPSGNEPDVERPAATEASRAPQSRSVSPALQNALMPAAFPLPPLTTESAAPSLQPASGETLNLSLGTLNAGQQVTITFAATIDDPFAASTSQVCNQGLISGSNFSDVLTDDPDTGSAADATCTLVDAGPDLSLAKDDGGISVLPGGTITYTLTYSNTGSQNAVGVAITDTVPVYTSFNPGASTAGWVCLPNNSAGSNCTLTVGALAAGAGASTITFTVDVDELLTGNVTEINNTAGIHDDGSGGTDLNITDNQASDTTPVINNRFSVGDVTLAEGNSGGTAFTFTISRTNTVSASSVQYQTADGTALAGSDYTATKSIVSFSAGGSPTQTITVNVHGDTLFEAAENFFVTLSNPSNGELDRATGVATIANDDTPPAIGINDVTVSEASGTAVFTVTLSAASGLDTAVDYSTADGTAVAPGDYNAVTTTTLTIPAGSTTGNIVVAVVDNAVSEGTRSFFVNLSSPINATLADDQAECLILDDDTTLIYLPVIIRN